MSDSETSEFNWTPAYEVQLMFAMIGLKPVGINQYFHMARIIEKFSAAINRTVEPETIWKHLNTWYDMEKLDEMEPLPFPIDDKDFELPEDEFGEMIEEVKRSGPRLDKSETQRKSTDDVKKESSKDDSNKDNIKEEDSNMNKNKSKVDKKTPLRRVSKSDKTDSSGAEESKEKDEDKEKALSGGRTRRSVKTEEPSKEDSNDSIKKNDPSSVKKASNKKEVSSSDSVKKKSISDSPEVNKMDANLKRLGSRTPVKNLKEPERTPKRVTRASFTPSEMESAKKKRKR